MNATGLLEKIHDKLSQSMRKFDHETILIKEQAPVRLPEYFDFEEFLQNLRTSSWYGPFCVEGE